MEVILEQNYPALGYVGDRVKVRGGYARNFLIPKGIASEASVGNEKVLKHRLSGISARKIKLKGEAQELATRLQPVKLEFTLKVGEGGKTFGAVTPKDIETSFKSQGFILDRKQISLVEPIKKVGEHKAIIKLHSEVSVTILVIVKPEAAAVKVEDKQEGEGGKGKRVAKGRGRGRKAAVAEDGAATSASAEEGATEDKTAE